MKISEKIIILRKRMGYSQEDLANELDISRQSVYKWESGVAVPELSKVKKIAKLFNISFDKLLDDEIDITVESVVVEKTPVSINIKKGYRETFVSNNKLNLDQADIDNGYPKERKIKNKNRKTIFEERIKNMKKHLEELGATSYLLLQDDLAGCFFENNNNKTFGFYFNGAVQFVCPYENYIKADLSNSGNNISYENDSAFSAFSGGVLGVIGIGKRVKPVLNKPLLYSLVISYFNKEGEVKEYNVSLFCNRRYIILEENDTEKVKGFDEFNSDRTNKLFNDIYRRLSICPVIAEKIHNEEIKVDEVDISDLNEKYAIQSKSVNEYYKSLEKSIKDDKKRKDKRDWIIAGIVVGIFIIILIIGEILSSTQKK